jgi:hypothetical protein
MSLLSTKDRWLYFFNGRLPKQCRTSAISAAEFLRERMPIQILLPNASLAIGKPVLHFGQVLFDPQAEVENNQRESAVNNIQVNNNIRNPNRIPQEQGRSFFLLKQPSIIFV